MAKKSPRKPSKNLKILLALLALLGAAIMAYLTTVHFKPEGSSFCDLGEGLSCDIVNKSQYAKFLGIPVSVLGLLYFVGVFGAIIWDYTRSTLRKVIYISIAFLGPSLYLTAIEIFSLENICLFCEGSKIVILAIIVTSIVALKPEKLGQKTITGAIILGLLMAGGMFLVNSATSTSVPSGKYDEFATCLNKKRCRMYGSATCQFCARQRALFGDSFDLVGEIECDPRNPNAQAPLCISKNIDHTPTWIIEDKDGNDVHRFESGVQSLENLSEATGCPLPEENAQ